jgi:NADPH-dependent 2,4-dienoyl-CoA reductase/sulfur reductase-like enzyme
VTERCDFAIIGAGPAGLAAAATAAELGLDVALFDEQPAPGGQIYRQTENSPLADKTILGPDYARGDDLAKAFRAAGVPYHPGSEIWTVTPERKIGILHDDAVRFVEADRILIAGGALERPVPFPGWTLPGVMTAGAGQVLMKASAMVPDEGVVLAGIGPLLFLVAWQYARAGVAVKAVIDLTPRSNYVRALPHLPAALLAGNTVRKGLALKREIRAAGIPILANASDLRALGETGVEAVEYTVGGRTERIETGLLLVHFGVVPNVALTLFMGVGHTWDARQVCWRVRANPWGDTNLDAVAVAGDCVGIAGALAAEWSGRLVALEAARALGRIDAGERDRRAAPIRAEMTADGRARPFLDALFQPPGDLFTDLADDVIVCRCEEVTAAQIRDAIALGCTGPNQLKAFIRAGMGHCQGRQCRSTVVHMIAHALGKTVDEIGGGRVRPPVKPVTLGQLATIGDGSD